MDWNQLFPPGEPVIALPDWHRPRLLISSRSLPQRVSDSGFYPAYTASAHAYRASLRLRAAAQCVEVRYAEGTRWALADYLGDLIDSPNPPSVRIGTNGAAQKWTMRITRNGGEVAAYVKWGQSRAGIRRLHHEYKILTGLPPQLGPAPLKFGNLGDGVALCLNPLPGKSLRAPSAAAGKLADFLRRAVVGECLSIDRHPGFREISMDAPL